jgi:rubredoxin
VYCVAPAGTYSWCEAVHFGIRPQLTGLFGVNPWRPLWQNPAFALGKTMKTYMCVICGYIYKEADGSPNEGIEPGTAWDDVPMNWKCPDCGVGKDDFEMMEI